MRNLGRKWAGARLSRVAREIDLSGALGYDVPPRERSTSMPGAAIDLAIEGTR
jgi:hypothetical protein